MPSMPIPNLTALRLIRLSKDFFPVRQDAPQQERLGQALWQKEMMRTGCAIIPSLRCPSLTCGYLPIRATTEARTVAVCPTLDGWKDMRYPAGCLITMLVLIHPRLILLTFYCKCIPISCSNSVICKSYTINLILIISRDLKDSKILGTI